MGDILRVLHKEAQSDSCAVDEIRFDGEIP